MLVRLLAALTAAGGSAACTGSDPGYKGQSSRDWIAALHSPDSLARRDAAFALGRVLEINPRASGVVDALVGALGDSSDLVRLEAGNSLLRERDLNETAVPGLGRALADSQHAHTREHAASLLGYASGPSAPQAAAALAVTATRDPDASVRAAAVSGLGRLRPTSGPAVVALRRATADSSAAVRQNAVEALSQLPVRDRASDIPRYASALRDPRPDVRATAAYALAASGPAAAATVPGLTSLLADPDADVRRAAAQALGQMGAAARGAIPELRRALADSNAGVQSEARAALARLGQSQ